MRVKTPKNFKISLEQTQAVKRRQEDVEVHSELDENRNSKKSKNASSSNVHNSMLLFEEEFKEVIKKGIDIYHNRILMTPISLKEKLAYIQILKKITMSLEWKSKRVVSNKRQFECLTQKPISTPGEKKRLLHTMEKFVDYKLKSFPGNTKTLKAESIAEHYKNELKCVGITQEGLTAKIDELLKAIDLLEGIPPKSEKKPNKTVQIMKMHMCRLCGSKDTLIYNLNQKRDNVQFRDIVEQFIRIKLNDDNNLPQLVCKICKEYIDGISKYAKKVSNLQQKLTSEIMAGLISPENIKTESDFDYNELPESTSAAIQNYINLDDSINDSISEQLYNEQDAEDPHYDESITINQCRSLESCFESSQDQNDPQPLLTEISTNNNNNIDKVISSEAIQNINESFEDNSSTHAPTSTSTPTTNSSALLRPCYLILKRLPIKYIQSDDDDDDDDDSPERLLIELPTKEKKRRGRRPRNLEADFEGFFSSIPNLNSLEP